MLRPIGRGGGDFSFRTENFFCDNQSANVRTPWISGSCVKDGHFDVSPFGTRVEQRAAALKTGWGKRPPHAVHDDRPCNCKHVPYCHPPLRKCVVSLHVFIVSDVTNHLQCNQRLSKPCVIVKCDLVVGRASFPTPKIRRIDHMPGVFNECVCCDRRGCCGLVS